MAQRDTARSKPTLPGLEDYRHPEATRKNNPPAALAAAGMVPAIPKAKYEYNPHLPPVLRFDETGKSDRLPELLAQAKRRALTEDELAVLAEALRRQEPWLEWSGKRESRNFAVDPVALHIHERVSAQAILKIAARQDVERNLFGDPQQAYQDAVQFYKHDVDWSNRLILGDSLQVMSSLAKREDLAGKVQMIYIDPPYGIKFASNFQPEVGKRDVRDKQEDLTREPEMVKAYRDTWELGIHSYLSYLRDRLIVVKELLADTGSIFMQISDENLHRVRDVLDEVFGASNFVSQIAFATTTGFNTTLLASVADHILWYGRDITKTKFRPLYREKSPGEEGAAKYKPLLAVNPELAAAYNDSKFATSDQITSQGASTTTLTFEMNGQSFQPPNGMHFKTNAAGLRRLAMASRLRIEGSLPRYMRLMDDFAVFPVANIWLDIGGVQSRTEGKIYVVQTATEAITRCLLMTTDPGDLVLDPTCGSGTSAYVAEQWGRRWITIDTSRVAVAIARQRLLTSKFDYFRLKNEEDGVGSGLRYKTVPHITLKSIAQNVALDPIFAKHEPILEEKLKVANAAMAKVDAQTRAGLETKLLRKEKQEGKKSITEADRRRWQLPVRNQKWEHWTVPFDTDPDYPKALAEAVTAYRQSWRAKMDDVNACINASAEQENLVDQPEVVRGVVRVSGPFTVEAVQPPEMMLGELKPEPEFAGAPQEVGPRFRVDRLVEPGVGQTPQDVAAYLDRMVRLLRVDGVRFPNNKQMKFSRLEPLYESGLAGGGQGFHAEGRWSPQGEADTDPQGLPTVGVVIGPQYGPVTAKMLDDLIRPASRRYEDLVVAGFSFTAEAQAILTEDPHLKLRLHIAHIRPDINPGMDGLLKEQAGSQLFTVFGLPRIKVDGPDAEGEYTVTMEGVDIYNPVDNKVTPTGADKVAAWFIDGDYDGRTFCITQAFFPDRDAWEKLTKALNGKDGLIDAERFAALSGTVSLPFPKGKNARVAAKVIDPRGNEVMSVHPL